MTRQPQDLTNEELRLYDGGTDSVLDRAVAEILRRRAIAASDRALARKLDDGVARVVDAPGLAPGGADFTVIVDAVTNPCARLAAQLPAIDAALVREVVREAVVTFLDERKLYIVTPQHPTMSEVALEAYGFGRACDAVALQGDDLQAVLSDIANRVADQLAGPPTFGDDQ